MTTQAVVYEISSSVDESPLLEKQAEMPDLVNVVRLTKSAFVLGLVVGFCIQFSTLGANYLAIMSRGDNALQPTKDEIIMFSIFWSFFTSAMAIVILAFLRKLVTASYSGGNAAATGRQEIDEEFDDVLLHMECRFVVGALVGVCLAWAATDIALGMSGELVYTLVTLTVALAWCRVMMWCFASGKPLRATSEQEIYIV